MVYSHRERMVSKKRILKTDIKPKNYLKEQEETTSSYFTKKTKYEDDDGVVLTYDEMVKRVLKVLGDKPMRAHEIFIGVKLTKNRKIHLLPTMARDQYLESYRNSITDTLFYKKRDVNLLQELLYGDILKRFKIKGVIRVHMR